MSDRGIFAVPGVSAARTNTIEAALQHLNDARDRHRDPRDTLKDLAASCGARITYPSYRTALRCGDIYTEAASSCDLRTAKLLLNSFEDKARRYLAKAGR